MHLIFCYLEHFCHRLLDHWGTFACIGVQGDTDLFNRLRIIRLMNALNALTFNDFFKIKSVVLSTVYSEQHREQL